MSLKAPIFIAAISIACIAFVFSLSIPFPVSLSGLNLEFSPLSPSGKASSAGQSCVILIVDESQDDSLIRETLSSGGLGDFIGESSQLVAVDNFGTLKYIPLDSFKNEIEAFDPRDDGYARKIGSFFVHEGKRFFFRLVDPKSGEQAGKIKNEAGPLLENIPHTFAVLEPGGFNSLHIVLRYILLVFVASSFAVLISRYRRLFVFAFPSFLLFAPCGFYSLILAAILTGVWELLREPLGEMSAAFGYRRRFRDYAGAGLRGIIERLKPFRVNLFLASLFLILLAVFSFFGIIHPILLAVVLMVFSFLYFLSLKAEAERARENRHILFTPVLLLPRKVKTFSFFPQLLPFVLMSIFALFLPQAGSKGNPSPVDQRYFVSQEEYERHVAFQRSFSYKPLGQETGSFQALNQTEYLLYYLGEDGLIAGSTDSRNGAETELFSAELSFPLEKLMDFLVEYNKPAAGMDGTVGKPMDNGKEPSGRLAANKLKEFLSVAIITAVCLMDFLRPLIAPKKSVPVLGDKRIAA